MLYKKVVFGGSWGGVHADLLYMSDYYCSSGGTGRPRGVAEMLSSNHTGADTTAPPNTHRDGDSAGTPTVWSAGTNTATTDWDYGNGNLAAAPASGNTGSDLAVATGSASQGLDYDSVFFLWQTGPWGGQVPQIG